MDALDFTHRPPRGPRVRLAGVFFTARAIDKLRAAQPGGRLAGYFDAFGFSSTWQYLTKIDIEDLRAVVAGAAEEADVEAWIDRRLTENGIDRARINAKMEAYTVDVMPEAMRAVFEATYPADVRAAHATYFDLFEADDARLYGPGNTV